LNPGDGFFDHSLLITETYRMGIFSPSCPLRARSGFFSGNLDITLSKGQQEQFKFSKDHFIRK
jgi:hypothetical protein